jgi:hypothetical protein
VAGWEQAADEPGMALRQRLPSWLPSCGALKQHTACASREGPQAAGPCLIVAIEVSCMPRSALSWLICTPPSAISQRPELLARCPSMVSQSSMHLRFGAFNSCQLSVTQLSLAVTAKQGATR